MRVLGYLIVVTSLAGCDGTSSAPVPGNEPDDAVVADSLGWGDFSGEPSIRGTITRVEGTNILVEEVPSEESGSAKAMVRIVERTVIRDGDGSSAEVAGLEVGEHASVWFTGPVAESYPVQATAGGILVGM